MTRSGTGDSRRFEADLDLNPNTKGRHHELRPVDPGDNAVYIHNMLVALDLPPVDPFDPNQVEDRIREYFEFCGAAGRVPNMVGMANWLGVDSKTLRQWKRGETDPQKYKVVGRMMTAFESLLVDYSSDGKINVAMGIFLLKNWFGYRDMQQVEIAQNNPMGEAVPAQELADKYLNLDGSDAVDVIDVGDAEPADELPPVGDVEADTIIIE